MEIENSRQSQDKVSRLSHEDGDMNNSSAVTEMGDRLATIDMGRIMGTAVLVGRGEELGPHDPSNTTWPEPRPTSVPSGTLIYPAVWRQ